MISKIKFRKVSAFSLISLMFLNCFLQTSCSNNRFKNGCVKIFFCAQYLSDSNSDGLDVIKEFENRCGIKVSAYSTFESNEQLYAKLKYGKFDYDVILPSDYMVSRMIKENMLQKIDTNLIKNYDQINSMYKGSKLGFDVTDEFSVPYTWGTLGVVYNKPLVEKITQKNAEEVVQGFDCLFNKNLEKEILMFSNSKDAFAIALKSLNYSINTTNENEIKEAASLLKSQKNLVQGYFVDEIIDKMINEEAAVSSAFSGDAQTMIHENHNLKFCLPKNGAILYVDAMCVPKNAKNVLNAHKFIDFMCDEQIAAQNCKFSSFSTTLKGAFNLLDYDLKQNYIAYPGETEINRCETQKFLDYNTEQLISNLWEKIKI